MALDFKKLNFFGRLDARSRVFVLLAGVVSVVFLVYLGTRFFAGGGETTGPSRVAGAPTGLQSVPGGQQTAEYQQALEQANIQRAQQARMTGGAAVPTMINLGQPGAPTGGPGQCIICSDVSANVKNNLDEWVKQGKVAPEVATLLEQLADKNGPVSEYAAVLDRLVKEGKLTPEQARELLEQYKKQHANALLQESANTMDDMIKSGQLPLDVANQLLTAQKNNISPSDYSNMLQALVREGKISPVAAQQLLAQYSQQRVKEIINQSIAVLHQMAHAGQLIPEIEKELIDLETRMVSLDAFTAALQRDVSAGKLIPAIASKILDEYKSQKDAIGPVGTINQIVQQAEAEAYAEINDLLKAKKMTPDVAAQLADMIQKNISLDNYTAAVNQLVQQNKLSSDIAKLKIADYQHVKCLRDMAQHLSVLQGNNASSAVYADELKRAVQMCNLPPDQAGQLMQEYLAMTTKAPVGAVPGITGPGAEAFAKLQQAVSQAGAAQPPVPVSEFAKAQVQVVEESAQERQARIDALVNAMNGQAQSLLAAWQPPTMSHRGGSEIGGKAKQSATAGASGSSAGSSTVSEFTSSQGGIPLIKAGTILFASLDTAVNSDYPESPVLATIVAGKYQGAKLLGKLTTTKSVAGQMDRIALNFTLMDMDEWPKSKTVTAYAIDPDTARTVLASTVDYHYMQRFGAIMATSFLQGYSTAITNEGTSTTGIFGTSSTHAKLSPTNKLAVGLGQIGQTLGTITQNWVNIPPTVRVDSGVGLGILFMSDVS